MSNFDQLACYLLFYRHYAKHLQGFVPSHLREYTSRQKDVQVVTHGFGDESVVTMVTTHNCLSYPCSCAALF